MALVLAQKIEGNKARVGTVYYLSQYYPSSADMPADENIVAIEVATVAEPDAQQVRQLYKGYEHYIDVVTKEQWFEYFDRMLTPEELKEQRFKDLEIAVAAILGGAL